jgi:hypothetical protein
MHYYDVKEQLPVRKEDGFGKKLDRHALYGGTAS